MKPISYATVLFALSNLRLFAADAGHTSIAEMQNVVLSRAEHEMVSLAEAMPADKYDFVPTKGAFQGARTFGQQMSHTATSIYLLSARLLGEQCPVDVGKDPNGPESLKSKEAIVRYLKDAFVYGHKATNSLTAQNFTEAIKGLAPGVVTTRGRMAEVMVWHTYDHYGQAVIYARMNGIIPPASRGQ